MTDSEIARKSERFTLGFRGSPTALAVFRVLFCTAFLLETIRLYEFRAVFFDPAAVHTGSSSRLATFLASEAARGYAVIGGLILAHAAALACLLVGYRTRLAAAVNYQFAVAFLGVVGNLLGYFYAADGLYIAGSLFLLIAPVSLRYSADARRARSRAHAPDQSVSGAWATVAAVVIGLFYADAVSWKSSDSLWRSGLSVWSFASTPTFVYYDTSWLTERRWLVVPLTYSVLAYQTSFPLLIWFRATRVAYVLLGIGLHAGIVMTFPLPLFSLASIAFLAALLPESAFRPFSPRPAPDDPRGPPPFPRAAVALIVAWIVACAWVNPYLGLRRSPRFVVALSGITSRGLFLNSHAIAPQPQHRVSFVDRSGRVTVLPIMNRRGLCGWYLTDRFWCYWHTLRSINRPSVTAESDAVRVAGIWCRRNGVDPKGGQVLLETRRPLPTADGWKPGVLHKNLAASWEHQATVGMD